MKRPARSKVARSVVAASLVLASLVGGVVPMGCDDEGSGTTGRRIDLEVRIAASPESKTFTNARGWEITLSTAAIGGGPFYFYDGETLFAVGPPRRSPWAVKRAFAHPGHYVAGNAKGEMVRVGGADLLAGATLGSGDGITGFARSATFTFAAPGSEVLGTNAIVVEGSARKDAETRAFRIEVAIGELKDGKGVPQIEGCPFVVADMQGSGVVSIEVKLPLWFDQVAFEDVPRSEHDEPVLLREGLARNQFVRGTRAGLAYVFSYAPR